MPMFSGFLRFGVFFLAIAFMANLNALADLVMHPDIHYFDREHLIVGGITGAVTTLLFVVLESYVRFRHQHLELLNRTLEERVEARTAELVSVNEKLLKEMNERAWTERAMAESEEKYRSLVESAEDSIYVVDREQRYVFMNRKHISRLGQPRETLIGQPYGAFHSPEETIRFREKIERVFTTGESFKEEHKSRRDGRYFLQTLSAVKDHEGKTIAVTVISKDITELKQMEDTLMALSLTDDLTGLYNRRGFLALALQELKVAKRLNKGLFVLYADLDNLKWINDTYGHQEGDRALQETGRILRNSCRDSDIVARFGGDEFVVLQIEAAETGMELLAERLRKNLGRYNSEGNQGYTLSLSTGTAWCDPGTPCSIEELLVQADRSMYEQKRLRQS